MDKQAKFAMFSYFFTLKDSAKSDTVNEFKNKYIHELEVPLKN